MRQLWLISTVLALLVCGCTGAEEDRTSVVQGPVDVAVTAAIEAESDVFSWDGHDISEWVTESEVTAVLDELSMEFAGVPLVGVSAFEAREDEFGVDMVWSVGPPYGPASWTVGLHDGTHIAQNSLEVSGSDITVDEFLNLDDAASDRLLSLERWLSANFSGTDPRLPEGVRHNGNNFGVYAFWAPEPSELICMWVSLPEVTFGMRGEIDTREEIVDEFETYEEIVFRVASTVLRELGWA